jgi:putative flippase GtrA
MAFINYIITILVVSISVDELNLNPYIGTVFSIMATFISGFLMAKLWVFRTGGKTYG